MAKKQIKEPKSKIDNRIIFSGELRGTYRDPALGDDSIIDIQFTDNGAIIATIGNNNFIPSSQDLKEARISINQIAEVLQVDKAKIIVGSWMDRIVNKTTNKRRK
jgi:hypothetical protein